MPKAADTETGASDRLVFSEEEQFTVSHHNYASGHANLTKQELVEFLEVLAQYSLRAPQPEQIFVPHQGLVRMIHAHNAVVVFRDRPFTAEEFARSVWAVLEGRESLLT